MTTSSEEAGSPSEWRSVEPLTLTPILAAALDAFYESGFHGASVRDIATRVGVTVPTLYYHHQSKEGLLIALLEFSVTDLHQRAAAADADGGKDPSQRLANVIFTIVLQMTNRARLAALEGEARYLGPENWNRYRLVRKEIEKLVVDILITGNAAGTFSVEDPAETTRAILGACQAIPRWYQSEGELSPAEVAAKYVTLTHKLTGAAQPPEIPVATGPVARS